MLIFIVVFKKLYKYVQASSANEHLQSERRRLVHLLNERGGLKTNLSRIFLRGKFINDRDAPDEAQVFLDLIIIKDYLRSSISHDEFHLGE